MTVETAKAMPVRTALSGPAAGVIAAAHIAEAAGFPNVITGDVGGTSFDVSLIARGETALAAQTTIDFGLVIRTPMIEITTIGAGGGSIAHVDRGGLLQVGPESAGAVPGPVCYGQGNTRPTLTDANVVLGRINADRPIGGGLKRLDVDAAKRPSRRMSPIRSASIRSQRRRRSCGSPTPHGGRHPPGVDRARSRSARLRADAVRRRRRACMPAR